MVVYDFIFGEKLAKNYIRGKYVDRFAMETRIGSLPSLVSVFYDKLTSAFRQMSTVSPEIDAIMSELGMFNNSLNMVNPDNTVGNGATDEINYYRLRELLAALAYNGYETFLVERADLTTTEIGPGTRAYMIDRNDILFPQIARVSVGYGLIFNQPADASVPNVVMTFVKNTINFTESTKQLINLNIQIEQYDALDRVKSGWQFDHGKLTNFLEDYGYQFVIVLQ